VFTAERREAVLQRMLRLGEDDDRIVAGAVVGSLAIDAADRFSDIDVKFGVTSTVAVSEVIEDWTATIVGELAAVRLVDLFRDPAYYRIFLLPGGLQLDLSMTPEMHFRPAGKKFRLVFGSTADRQPASSASVGDLFISTPRTAADIFGWGVVYALHAHACIERRRVWQAEHYVGMVRDHALALACLRHRLTAAEARAFDDLPDEVLGRFERAHIGSLQSRMLKSALTASTTALLNEAEESRIASAKIVRERLAHVYDSPGVRPLSR